MDSATHTWQKLPASLVIAIGIALVWGMLVGWGLSVVDEVIWPTIKNHESISVTTEGTPLIRIQTRLTYNHYKNTYRTFDGQPATVPRGGLLDESHIQAPIEPPGLWHSPIEWRYRIKGISDLGQPPIGWYLIRDDQPSGHAYLVGYDLKSEQLAGYIGRSGFSASLPAKEERFEHDNRPYGWRQGSVCSTGYLYHGQVAPSYDYNPAYIDRDFLKWMLFLIDGDRLQEVDLRTRKVRTIYQSPNLAGVSFLSTKEDTEKDGKKKMVRRLMLRLTDRIVLLDRPTGGEQEYLLPESMQKQRLSVYPLDDGQLLLVSQSYGGEAKDANQAKLVWYSPNGQMTHEKEVSLIWPGQAVPEPVQMAMVGLVAPIPLGWMVGGGIFGPLVMAQENKVPDYSAGLQKAIAEGWPGMIVPTLLALLAAAIALRLHRRYHRPRPWLWWLFVFLLGPAGLLAYWLGHPRAVLEECPACSRTVPRDRDGCAACGEAFAPPALVGTEIFA